MNLSPLLRYRSGPAGQTPARALLLWRGPAGAHLSEAFLIRVGVNGGFDETVRCYFL